MLGHIELFNILIFPISSLDLALYCALMHGNFLTYPHPHTHFDLTTPTFVILIPWYPDLFLNTKGKGYDALDDQPLKIMDNA